MKSFVRSMLLFVLLVVPLGVHAETTTPTIESLQKRVQLLTEQIALLLKAQAPDLKIFVNHSSDNVVQITPIIAAGFPSKRLAYWKLDLACDEDLSIKVKPDLDLCKNVEYRIALSSIKKPKVDFEMFKSQIVNSGARTGVAKFTLSARDGLGTLLGSDTVGVVVAPRK